MFDLGNLSGNETESLRIDVFHHHFVRNDDFMGQILIRARDLYRFGPGQHLRWFFLGSSRKEDLHDRFITGQIALQISIMDLPP